MSRGPAAPPPGRAATRLLADRTFGPWFWGNLISNSGNWLFNVTAAVLVFQVSGSALLVGLVSVAQFVPLAVVSPWAGALSDRIDRRRLLITSQAVSATAATAFAVVVVAVGADSLPGAWPILATAFGIGVGQAFSLPALNALVPALVDDDDLESGVALTTLTFNVGRALGPASAGVLLVTAGVEAAFVANAASFVAFMVALLIITPRARPPAPAGDRSIRAGLRYVRADRVIILLMLGVAATGFAADPMITLAPPLAEALGGGDALVAILVSSFGVAAAPSAVISVRLQRAVGSLRVAQTGGMISIAGLVITALAGRAGVAVAGFAVCGVGFVLSLTGLTTQLQRRVPDEFRGRVMAFWAIAFLGNRPLAAVIDGSAADLVGPRWALLIAMSVAAGATVISARLRRQGN